MIEDPIIREIRAYRDELAERFKGDPQGFYDWLKEREEEGRRQGRKYVSRPPKRVARKTAGRPGAVEGPSAGNENATRAG